MLVMIGVYRGKTLVLLADLHTLRDETFIRPWDSANFVALLTLAKPLIMAGWQPAGSEEPRATVRHEDTSHTGTRQWAAAEPCCKMP